MDAEIKADAFAQAQLIATTANDDLDRPGVLQGLVERSARAVGGRVIVVDARGRILADSAGPGLRGSLLREPTGDRRGAARRYLAGHPRERVA